MSEVRMQGFTEFKDPMRGTVKDFPVLIMGVLGDTRLLCIDIEGNALDVVITEVRMDVRFDLKKREWIDLTPMQPDE